VTAVDPHQPNEPDPLSSTLDETIAAALVNASNVKETRPPVARLPLILIGAAAAVGGVLTVLAFVMPRTATPIEAAQPAPVAPAPTAKAVEPAPVPTWTGEPQARWAHDGSKTISFELQATGEVPVWMSRARPVLVVRCLSRRTDAYVILGTSAGYEAQSDRRTIRLQWDDDPLTVEEWLTSESAQELFAPNGIAFVRRLTAVNRLRFGFTPFNTQPVTAEFAVQGFDRLAGMVARTCGWQLDERTATRSTRLN
jgi:hypothetical protein